MSAKYLKALQQLLPQGAAWAQSATSQFVTLLGALAVEFQRVDDKVASLLVESLSSTSVDTDTLTTWETLLQIANPVGTTTAGRKAAIRSKLSGYADPTRQFSRQTFTDIAEGLGYTIFITFYSGFRVDHDAVGTALAGDAWLYSFQITTTSGVNDEALEAAIALITPPHTTAVFTYV